MTKIGGLTIIAFMVFSGSVYAGESVLLERVVEEMEKLMGIMIPVVLGSMLISRLPQQYIPVAVALVSITALIYFFGAISLFVPVGIFILWAVCLVIKKKIDLISSKNFNSSRHDANRIKEALEALNELRNVTNTLDTLSTRLGLKGMEFKNLTFKTNDLIDVVRNNQDRFVNARAFRQFVNNIPFYLNYLGTYKTVIGQLSFEEREGVNRTLEIIIKNIEVIHRGFLDDVLLDLEVKGEVIEGVNRSY